jgi:Protein of unknown function (DUF3800)
MLKHVPTPPGSRIQLGSMGSSGQLLVLANVTCDPPRLGGCGLSTRVRLPIGTYILPFSCPVCSHVTMIPVHLHQPKVVHPPQSKVYAFGDESAFGNVIAYGLAVVEGPDLPRVERFFSGLKQRYGIDSRAEFHCRIVFSGDQRRKSAWRDLSPTKVLEFAEELISGLVGMQTRFIVGAAHRSEQPEELPAVENWAAIEMGTDLLQGIACLSALNTLNQHYDQHRVEFRTDPNRKKIPLAGRRIQAHSLYKLNNSDTNQHIAPEPVDPKDKPALLQVADLFAYTATHSLTEKKHRNKERFEHLYKLCSPVGSFMGYHAEDETEFKPLPSRLESRHRKLTVL